ncbi:hypothetical protein HKX48_007864 [Thoreauomyces humboldtii]|nr:hypothetical protein HKX48_007864 [Thoreauomyces humboldtii]
MTTTAKISASLGLKASVARPPSIATELAQAKNQINNFRDGIDILERTFRENVILRRGHFQPYAVFSPEVPSLSMSNDDDYAAEMISRAKADLLKQSGQKKKLEEESANQKLDSEEQLRTRIAETRSKFRAKEALLEAGPKFVHYFCSTYGEALFIHALGTRLYAVFASNNWLAEFWEFAPETSIPHLRDVVQLSTLDSITTVCHLFSDLKRPDTSEEGGSDTSSRRSSNFLSSAEPSRRPSNASSTTSDQPIARAGSSSLQPVKSAGNSLWGGTTESSRRRISARTRVIGNVMEEEDGGEQNEEAEEQGTFEDSPAKFVRKNSTATVGAEQEPAELAAETTTQHTFFLGCQTGLGATFVIDITWVRETDISTYVHSVCSTRQLSLAPIKLTCFVEYDDSIVCLVSHSGTDQVLGAYSLELEDIWQCKGDVLRYTAKDKQLKVIAQTRLESVKEKGPKQEDERPNTTTDEPFISAMTADLIQKHLLVAMRSGAILRLNCETITVGGTKKEDPNVLSDPQTRLPAAPELPPMVRKDLFVAWCLEMQPLASPSLGPSRIADEGPEKGMGKAVYSFRTTPEIVARHIATFLHYATNKPFLLLCCTDGTLRMYPMDMGLATATPIVYTYADQDRERGVSSDLALVWADEVKLINVDGTPRQFLVAYTADGIFVIYNISAPEPLLEKRILSNRAANIFREQPPVVSNVVGSRDELGPASGSLGSLTSMSTRATPSTPSSTEVVLPPALRKCRMLDNENGTCVISAGREWALVDLKNLQGWDVKHTNFNASKSESGRK